MRLWPHIMLFFALLFVGITPTRGQSHSLLIQKSETPPILDGHLDDRAWQNAPLVRDFQMQYPHDDRPANSKTEVRVFYTEKALYIGAICRDTSHGNYVVQSLKRDFLFEENDAFSVIIDPFGDAVSGYAFTVHPYGTQSDGIVDLGGIKGSNTNWDAVWNAEVFRNNNEDWWSLEIEIPFNSLRFNNSQSWRINFARNDLRRNETSVWSPVPRGTDVATLALAGLLEWDKSPPKDGSNIALIPYAALNITQNYRQEKPAEIISQVGGDAKIALNSSLYLDFTVNPDFSQAEVDRQVIDLNRFELNYPEKRLFFLENKDLFANLGNSRVRPFFSRRIGGVGSRSVPILFGARLTGRLDKDWRIGLMNMQTEGQNNPTLKGQNYSVAVVQRSILKGSNLTAFLINRQGFNEFEFAENDFNRIGGVEFDFRSPDSKWSAKTFLHYSFTAENLKENAAWDAKIRYRTAKFNFFLGADAPGQNYITDFGFVPHLYHRNTIADTLARVAYRQLRANGYYRIFPKDDTYGIDFYGFEWAGNLYTDPTLNYQEHDLKLTLSVKWLNANKLSFSWGNYAPALFFPFQLDGLDLAFPAGIYQGRGIEGRFDTGVRNNFFGTASIRYGGEYTGRQLSLSGALNYRRQPWGLFGLTIAQETLTDFPEGYGSAAFTLIGSKLELSFNRNLFLTTFLQYNTQLNNFNVNTRLQWRIKAMSDLFITYTDNYRADNLYVKDRAIVLKVRYWIGL